MAAPVVYEGVPNANGNPKGLFAGQRLWFSVSVPLRKWLIENAEANGAEIVPLEKQADVLLIDHARKNAAPGTHSYRYVELSIRNGILEDLADHVVGARDRVNRTVGSVTTAPKGGRNAFTDMEDQLLWDWVKPYEEMGEKTGGNVIYQQLESVNGRHTYQSWRDRWLKKVQFQKREVKERNLREKLMGEDMMETQGPSTQQSKESVASQRTVKKTPRGRGGTRHIGASAGSEQARISKMTSGRSASTTGPKMASPLPDKQFTTAASPQSPVELVPGGDGTFTMEQAKMLLNVAGLILDCPVGEELDASWKKVAETYGPPRHNAQEWREFFDTVVVPAYKRKKARRKAKASERTPDRKQDTRAVRGQREETFHEQILQEMVEEGEVVLDKEQTGKDEVKAAQTKQLHQEHTPRHEDYVDRGTSPIQAPDVSPIRIRVQSQRSPSFQPQSPTLPRPNQGRKRNPDKGSKSDSQESNITTNNSTEVVHDGAPDAEEQTKDDAGVALQQSPLKRKRSAEDDGGKVSGALLSLADYATTRLKRVRRLLGQDNREIEVEHMEIPSTPPTPPTPPKGTKRGLDVLKVGADVESPGPISPSKPSLKRSESPLLMPRNQYDPDIGTEDQEKGKGRAQDWVGSEDEEEELPKQDSGVKKESSAEKFTSGRRPQLQYRRAEFASDVGSTTEVVESTTISTSISKDEVVSGKDEPSHRLATWDVSSGGEDSEVENEHHRRTNPLPTSLVGDNGIQLNSLFSQSRSQSQSQSQRSGSSEVEATPESKTVLEMSQLWETAPEEVTVIVGNDEETATRGLLEDDPDVEADGEDQVELLNGGNQRIATQALFEQDYEIDEDEFALPEPEGGWPDEDDAEKDGQQEEGEQEIPETYQDPIIKPGTSNHSQSSPSSDDSAGLDDLPTASEIDEYVDRQLGAHADMDEEWLLMALDATCMDEALVPTVYESIAAGTGVPEGIRGVWTADDDGDLEGSDPAGLKRVRKKHGSGGIRRRWAWREGVDLEDRPMVLKYPS